MKRTSLTRSSKSPFFHSFNLLFSDLVWSLALEFLLHFCNSNNGIIIKALLVILWSWLQSTHSSIKRVHSWNWWMTMNYFCGMVDRRKVFSLISSQDHCQRFSPSRISDTPRAGFERAQNLSWGLVEWSCAVLITITVILEFSHLYTIYRPFLKAA